MNINKYLLIFFILLGFLGLAESSQAERFFQQNNTWYDKIPANPVLYTDSANYIQDILINANQLIANFGEWSVPIYYAPAGTANVTVTMDNPTSPYCGSNAISNG